MPQCYYIGAELTPDLVNSASTKPAASIATVVRTIFEQLERRIIDFVQPLDIALLQIFTERMDWGKKFALLDCKRTDREFDRGSLLEEQECFEQGNRILTAG